MLRFIILSLLSLVSLLSSTIGCSQTCSDPLTSTPFGSPCVCVLPMKVRLLLGVNVLSIFQEINELEIEVAAGTYLKQSQVVIRGVVADSLDQEKAVVDIDLIPLSDKFSNTTISLIHQRFIQKKVHLEGTLFGDYDMLYIKYPGLPDLPSSSNPRGTQHPEYPISVDFGHKKQKMNRQMIFIIALSALVLLVVCFVALAILFNCRRVGMSSGDVSVAVVPHINKIYGKESVQSSRPTSSTSGSFVSAMPASVLSVITFALAELERATENFSSENVLGEGGFGRVYHGIMGNGTEVAVKLLKRVSQNGDFDFISEVKMLSRLHHRNLVKLIGICIEGGRRCLVYELVSNGSLESHLHGADRSKGPLSWDARLKIALGAARGLAYLHEDSNPCVIHRDFKSSNVLLEDDFTPKVSDFGLAREAAERSHHISTRVMGTFGYVAPEYAMTGHLLVKSDVYSYGVVLLELLTGRKPVELFRDPGQENLVMWARTLLANREALDQLADPALSGTCDPDDLARVAAVASMCVHLDVSQRPFMGEVVQALKLVCKSAEENNDGCSSSVGHSSCYSGSNSDVVISDGSWWSGPRGLGLASGPGNRSEPLGVMSKRDYYYRLRGSVSEHSRWAGTGRGSRGGGGYDDFF